MRILCLNTWHGYLPRRVFWVESIEPEGHKVLRTRALLAQVRELDPDAILLQECLPQPSYSLSLAEELGYDVVSKICNSGIRVFGRGVPVGIGSGEGLAILAKPELGLRRLGVRRLSGVGFTSARVSFQLGQLRFALAAQVSWNGRPMVLVNTHLRYAYPTFGHFESAWRDLQREGVAKGSPGRGLVNAVKRNIRIRDAEVRRLGAWISGWSRQRIPVILGSDLNLDYDAPQILSFCGDNGLTNVLPAVSDRVCTWEPEVNTNISFSTSPTHPDGAPKDVSWRLVAHYDAIAQSPDHLMLGPTFDRAGLRDGGLAIHLPHEGVFPSDHYGIFADV